MKMVLSWPTYPFVHCSPNYTHQSEKCYKFFFIFLLLYMQFPLLRLIIVHQVIIFIIVKSKRHLVIHFDFVPGCKGKENPSCNRPRSTPAVPNPLADSLIFSGLPRWVHLLKLELLHEVVRGLDFYCYTWLNIFSINAFWYIIICSRGSGKKTV